LRVWGLVPWMGTPLACPQPDDLGDRSINPPPEGNTPDPSIEKMIYYRIERSD
jgi:hypothetical protein